MVRRLYLLAIVGWQMHDDIRKSFSAIAKSRETFYVQHLLQLCKVWAPIHFQLPQSVTPQYLTLEETLTHFSYMRVGTILVTTYRHWHTDTKIKDTGKDKRGFKC